MKDEILDAITALIMLVGMLLATIVSAGPNDPITGRSMVFILAAGAFSYAIARGVAGYWR